MTEIEHESRHLAQPQSLDPQHEQQKLAKKIKNFIYDPTKVIGSGFSSKVYKGINQLNNQQVAIKVIQLSKIQNQVEKYLLNNEINALRALNHKNVLKTIDILMTKNNVYIVTQFCEFGDLQKMIKNAKTLNQRDALNITKDIVQGYIAVQQKGITHRDLKTANIFLTKIGAKIADFGFCEFSNERKPQIAYNVGSPAYMSPQSYKQNMYSSKSDIWGIGIILYEMLLGETPDKNLTYNEMSENLINGNIKCRANDNIKEILSLCFKRNVNERVNSHDLLEVLKKQIARMGTRRNQNGQQSGDSSFTNMNRFGKGQTSSQLSLYNQQQRVMANKAFRFESNPLKYQTDDFRTADNVSPRKNLEDAPHISLNNPTLQGSDELNRPFKYQGYKGNPPGLNLNSSGTITVGTAVLSESSKKLKRNIEMLQFVFRLLKYINEISIETVHFLKLILFRHRSYIDQAIQNTIEQYKINKQQSQLYRQFQYLKMKFDQIYLSKDCAQPQNHELMSMMNRFANTSFNDKQSLKNYQSLIKKGCKQIQTEVIENRSTSFVAWDYLMLEFELLELYKEDGPENNRIEQNVNLQQILKEQPKNITLNHIELLKIKSRVLFQS